MTRQGAVECERQCLFVVIVTEQIKEVRTYDVLARQLPETFRLAVKFDNPSFGGEAYNRAGGTGCK